MMKLQQYLLCKLAEECTEVAKIALKIQQFGANEVCPGQVYTNVERLHQELDDIQASVDMLNDKGLEYDPSSATIAIKKARVVTYLKKSVALGAVEPGALKEVHPEWEEK
jgi:hypothetical protein